MTIFAEAIADQRRLLATTLLEAAATRRRLDEIAAAIDRLGRSEDTP